MNTIYQMVINVNNAQIKMTFISFIKLKILKIEQLKLAPAWKNERRIAYTFYNSYFCLNTNYKIWSKFSFIIL